VGLLRSGHRATDGHDKAYDRQQIPKGHGTRFLFLQYMAVPENGDLSKFNPSNPLARRTWSKPDFTRNSSRTSEYGDRPHHGTDLPFLRKIANVMIMARVPTQMLGNPTP
jgi:hypothetical protein